MTTIVTRAGKGTPLTNNEVDTNFTNLNTDKLELGGTFSSGTANSVLFLNGSKALTTGSALTFDGTNLLNDQSTASPIGIRLRNGSTSTSAGTRVAFEFGGTTTGYIGNQFDGGDFNTQYMAVQNHIWFRGASEKMRLTDTGLKASIAGTNADPVFSYTSDTNTGIFFPAADKLGFVAGGGSDQMVLTTTGLGIGTNNPSGFLANKLVIATGGTANEGITIYSSSNNGSLWFADATTGAGRYAGGIDYQHATNELIFYSNSQGNMRLDSSGNLGLGVTPSAWFSTIRALQIGSVGGAFISGNTSAGGGSTIGLNTYFDAAAATARYGASSFASRYTQLNGAHEWYTAPSGTANDPITFTQAMTLDASGNLLVGETARAYLSRFTLSYDPASTNGPIFLDNRSFGIDRGGSLWLGGRYNSSNDYRPYGGITARKENGTDGNSAGYLAFATNNNAADATERARISADGTFRVKGAGTAGSTDAFQVAGTAPASAMTLDASGDLAIGDTATNGIRLSAVKNNPTRGIIAHIYNIGTSSLTGSQILFTQNTIANWVIGQPAGEDAFAFWSGRNTASNGTERARITSGGTFQTSLDASIYGVTVGRGAGAVATNTALGVNALAASNSGTGRNTGLGYAAMAANTTGVNNTGVGQQALTTNQNGSDNIAVGYASLFLNVSGSTNVAVGVGSLQNTTASNNTAVGHQSLTSNLSASNNTAFGYQAGYANTTGRIVAVGYQALVNSTTASANTAVGYVALQANTTGAANTAVGDQALNANTTASNNTAVGYQAGYSNTTGTDLVAVGYQSANNVTTGAGNVAVGSETLQAVTTGSDNIAIGRFALESRSTSSTGNVAIGYASQVAAGVASYNTSVGYSALRLVTTGANNVAVGTNALYSNTTASNNTAVGYEAGYSNTTGTENTAVGYQAFHANTIGNYNSAFGYTALKSNTTGSFNTATGREALFYNTTGGNNTADGFEALFYNTTGANNTAVGFSALVNNTTASNNTAVGYQAAYSTQTGSSCVAIGYQTLYNNTGGDNDAVGNQAMYSTTTGNVNAAFGQNAMRANTTGSSNVAIGSSALRFNTTASNNTAVGYQAGYSNTTGADNIYVGVQAGYTNTTSSQNTAVGRVALYNNTGASNSAFGYGGLSGNTSGANNTAVGVQALNANTTASDNTAVGYQAGYSQTTGGGANVFIGKLAGFGITTGSVNTFVGTNSGDAMTTGTKNVILGRYSGNQGGLDIRTASNYIVLSDGDGNPRVYHDGSQLVVDKPLTTGLTKRTVFSFNRQTEYINGIRLRTPLGYVNDGFYQVTLRGYHYRKGASADLTVCWYGYSVFGYPIALSVTTSGGWSPTVYLKNNGSGGTDIYFGIDDSDGYYLFGDVDVTSISAIPTSGWSVDDTAYTSGGVDVPYVQQIGKAAGQVGQGTDARLYVTKGITFPATQNASSNANTLDDYEEGSWTPTTSASGVTLTNFNSYYTKIGRLVHVYAYVEVNNSGGTLAGITWTGLPFAALSYAPALRYYKAGTGSANTQIWASDSYTESGAAQIVDNNDIGSGISAIMISATYFVS